MIPCNEQLFALIKVVAFVIGAVIVLWKYIDRNIKLTMEDKLPPTNNRIPAIVKAAGCAAAFATLQLPIAKAALNFLYYGVQINMYEPVNAGMLLAALYYGVITGGRYLTGNGSPNKNSTPQDGTS